MQERQETLQAGKVLQKLLWCAFQKMLLIFRAANLYETSELSTACRECAFLEPESWPSSSEFSFSREMDTFLSDSTSNLIPCPHLYPSVMRL